MTDPVPSQTGADAVYAERRTRVRYLAVVEVSVRRTGEAAGQSCSGRIVNISAGGIGLLLRRRFLGDTLLDVEVPAQAGCVPCLLQVRVIHATPFKDEGASAWLLGCTFARELTERELRSLLCTDKPA
jgi:hypothetical protein